MKIGLHVGRVEEVHDTDKIFAGSEATSAGTTALQSFRNRAVRDGLMIARLVDIVDDCQSLVELFVSNSSQADALRRSISKSACTSDSHIIIVSHIGMSMEEFVLIDRHSVLTVH